MTLHHVEPYSLCMGKFGTAWRNGACEKNKILVLQWVESGDVSLTEIGRRIGTTRRMVRLFLKRNGIHKKFSKGLLGERSPNWKGGIYHDKDGYTQIYAPNHPNRKKHLPYQYEHRLVVESHIGRYLLRSEVVHHKNGNKKDNRIENLEIFSSNGEHLKHELRGRCPKWSKEGMARLLKASLQRTLNAKLRKSKEKSLFDGPKCI